MDEREGGSVPFNFARKTALLASVGVLALTAATGICTAQASAQSAPNVTAANGSYDFNIPGQPLSQALKNFGLQASSQIMFSEDVVRGQQSTAVRGHYSPQEALAMLLKQTDLKADTQSGGMIVIERKKKDDAEAAKPAAVILAQAAPPPPPAPASSASAGVEQVVVSASRISIAGYQAPTPVTVVGSELLERDALPDLGNALRNLPSFGGSTSPDNSRQSGLVGTGAAGLNEVSLRNLGVTRTLVLIDGQRVVPSNINDSAVDLSTIPSTLIQRVDVVTGGASAAWGSDAVAGVVNLILNKNMEGLKLSLEGSDNEWATHESYKFEAAYGMSLLGGRAHILLGGYYYDSPQSYFVGQAHWFKAAKLVNNPAFVAGNGQPQLIHATQVGLSQATAGGLITAGPLRGTQFVGPNGTPAPFNFGNANGSISNGGSAEVATSEISQLSVPHRSQTAFVYASYKITPDIQASVQLNYGGAAVINNSLPKQNLANITIKSDNAYLPASIQSAMASQSISSFQFGTTNLNNLQLSNGHLVNHTLADDEMSLGVPVSVSHRQLLRGVASLDGSIGDNWSWNAYYQHGDARAYQYLLNNVQTTNYNNAIDAVTVTASNVGKSGLPLGQIACRSTLTNPTNGCFPLDLFGNGVASQGAIQYVNGAARAGLDNELSILTEDVAAASMQGQLPWDLGAGAISIAFGGEYRKEAAKETASPLAVAAVFNVGNFNSFQGHNHVEEGFLELDVPLLKNNFVDNLALNAAGRITDYSTSGLVETWKVGLTSQVNEDIRLRTTMSFDIRAPDLYELFNTGLPRAGTAVDPKTGQGVQIFTLAGGNPDLVPELARTISGGAVLTPHWVPGLSISADWYSISITGAIVTIPTKTILDNCKAGQQLYCDQLVFGGVNGALSVVKSNPLNVDSQSVSGLDFQADYATDLFGNNLALHAVGNYTDEQTETTQGVPYDYAGSIGGDSPYQGVPKFKTTLSATYSMGAWQGTIQSRIIGSARLVNTWTNLNVDDNEVPAVAYLDLRASYRWSDNIQLYAALDNAFDAPPPTVASSANSGSGGSGTRDDLYGAYGREFRLGVRLTY